MNEQEYFQEFRRLSLLTTESFIHYFWKTKTNSQYLNNLISQSYVSLDGIVY